MVFYFIKKSLLNLSARVFGLIVCLNSDDPLKTYIRHYRFHFFKFNKNTIMKNHINEYKEHTDQELSEQELLETSNVSDKKTGVKDVVIWIGANPKINGYGIKISNIPNKTDGIDLFTITIPEFNIIGKDNKSFIDSKKLKDIKRFIELNKELIIAYSNYEVTGNVLMDNLKSIK